MNLIDPPTLTAGDPIPGAPRFACCRHCRDDYMCNRREGHAVPCVDGCNDKEVSVP